MGELEMNMTIDDCVNFGHTECTEKYSDYLSFIFIIQGQRKNFTCQIFKTPASTCGEQTDIDCFNFQKAEYRKDSLLVKQMVHRSKIVISNNYYIVGILEDFKTTLNLFEKMMPDYFTGVLDLLEDDWSQEKQDNTTTRNKDSVSGKARRQLQENLLKWEYDVYKFTKALFYE